MCNRLNFLVMGWILFLIGLWLIPFILCLVLSYFCWREERVDDKTLGALFEYLTDTIGSLNYWPIMVPFVNILIVLVFILKYLYLLFKDTELW